MPSFYYRAVDKSGKTKTGRINRPNATSVAEFLKVSGLFVIEVKKSGFLTADITELDIFKAAVSTRELSAFCRQLAFILDAGIEVAPALGIILRQATGKRLKETVYAVRERLLGGDSLYNAMKASDEFPALLVEMVNVGEVSGSLPSVFLQMADYYEKSHKTQEDIKSAMLYPAVVSTMMLAVVIVSVVFVVPNYAMMFEQSGAQLPGLTRALIAVSDFTTHNAVLLLCFLFLSAVGIMYARQTPYGRKFFDGCKLNMFVLSSVYIKMMNLQFAQAFCLMTGAGLRLIDAATIAKNVIGNAVVGDILDDVINKMAAGAALSDVLESEKYFEPILCGMMRVGEETGRLPEAMAKCADYFQNEADALVLRLNKLIEPLITLILGLVLGFIMLAIMLPAFSLTNVY